MSEVDAPRTRNWPYWTFPPQSASRSTTRQLLGYLRITGITLPGPSGIHSTKNCKVMYPHLDQSQKSRSPLIDTTPSFPLNSRTKFIPTLLLLKLSKNCTMKTCEKTTQDKNGDPPHIRLCISIIWHFLAVNSFTEIPQIQYYDPVDQKLTDHIREVQVEGLQEILLLQQSIWQGCNIFFHRKKYSSRHILWVLWHQHHVSVQSRCLQDKYSYCGMNEWYINFWWDLLRNCEASIHNLILALVPTCQGLHVYHLRKLEGRQVICSITSKLHVPEEV